MITSFLVEAKRVETKVMHGQNREAYQTHYDNSLNHQDTKEEILSSTTEASGEVIFMMATQISSDATSQNSSAHAKLSYLDKNRIEITEDMARGEGEHLETLLSMIKPHYKQKHLTLLQKHFDEFIYLNSNDFLKKVDKLI
jgi:hypothetical protein